MYKLLQNQALTNFHNEINELGWEKACETYPSIQAKMDCQHYGTERFTLDMLPHYTHVADIDANELEDAFFIHNNPHGDPILEEQITRYATQHSLSVGDILEAEDGGLYMCDPMGFKYVGKEQGIGYMRSASAIIR
jgi:hypothetical protein